MLGWRKHMLESRLLGEISITSDMQIAPPIWQKVKNNSRVSWLKWWREEESEKIGLKPNIQKIKITVSSPIIPMQIDWKTVETGWHYFYLFGGGAPKSLQKLIADMKLKNALLGRKLMTNLNSILKSRHISLPKCLSSWFYGFPVVMYGCVIWTIKKAEHQELMLLNCGVGEDSWESFGLQGDSTSSS